MKQITCDGLTIEEVLIPEFAVDAGESVCIMWPVGINHPAISQFNQLLQSNLSTPVRLTGTVCFADRLWWETTLFGVNSYHIPERYLPSSWLRGLRKHGWLQDFLIWKNNRVLVDTELERHLNQFRSPSGTLILESSEMKLASCLLCERHADITIFDQRTCTPGKLIDHLEQESLQNTLIEYRFSDRIYPIDKTYRNARIINFRRAEKS